MNRDQVTRQDFPEEDRGYGRASVDAHLTAVEALLAASEAEVAALKVERDALRRAAGSDPAESREPALPPPVAAGGEAQAAATASDDEVSARLVATKLVMDGTDRESIRERLERDYDLSDTDGLIDDLFERLG